MSLKPLVTVLFLAAWSGGCAAVCPVEAPRENGALRQHLQYGYRNLDRGDCEGALREFGLAQKIDPCDPEARLGRQDALRACQPEALNMPRR